MKKSFAYLFACLGVITSCGNDDTSQLKILCPTGAPSVAFYQYADQDNFSTNSAPSNIVHEMTSSSPYDLIVIDTVSGMKAISSGAPYSIASTITFGNFFLASTGNDDDGVMDENDKIILFGQGQTPDKLFHYLYGNQYDSALEYVTNAQMAGTCLASGKDLTMNPVDYVFLAQPAVYAATKKNPNAKVYANIQEEYQKKSGGLDLIQASIFVKNSADKMTVNALLSSLEKDIDNAIDKPSLVQDGLSKIGNDEAQNKYGAASAAFVSTLSDNNSLGLGYKEAKGNKKAIDSFLSLFGMENTDEAFYYQK